MATMRRQAGGTAKKGMSEYALENLRRQKEWEKGFQERIEAVIAQVGGPGKVQELAHIKSQSLQKIRKGGSRLAFLATIVEVLGLNANWLLLGTHSERRFRGAVVGVVPDEAIDQIAVPSRRPKTQPTSGNARRRK